MSGYFGLSLYIKGLQPANNSSKGVLPKENRNKIKKSPVWGGQDPYKDCRATDDDDDGILKEEYSFRVFENRVLSRIFGP
jgi:hypothetical protein